MQAFVFLSFFWFFLSRIRFALADASIEKHCPDGEFKMTMVNVVNSPTGSVTYQTQFIPSKGGKGLVQVTSCTLGRFGAGCTWRNDEVSQFKDVFVKHPLYNPGLNYTGSTVNVNSCDCDGQDLKCKSGTFEHPVVDPNTGAVTIYLFTNIWCRKDEPNPKTDPKKMLSDDKTEELVSNAQYTESMATLNPSTSDGDLTASLADYFDVKSTKWQLNYLVGWCGTQKLDGGQWATILTAWFNDFKRHPKDDKDVIGQATIADGARASIRMRYLSGNTGEKFTLDDINHIGNAMEDYRQSKGNPSRSQYILSDKTDPKPLAQLYYVIDLIGPNDEKRSGKRMNRYERWLID